MPVDPVCNMEVSPGEAESEYKGTTYYFCNRVCSEKFLEEPGKYVGLHGVEFRK